MRFCKGFRTAGVTALVVIAAAASPAAVAAPCGGFTDVDDTNPAYTAFCANVQWVKNRNITLGCTSATLYCPTQSVTRIQMAAFMNRVGDALTPTDLGPIASDSNNVPVDLTVPANQIRCAMPADIPAANYPRRAEFNNKVNLYNPTARVDILAEVVFSNDGGVSWIAVPDSKTYQTVNGGLSPPDDVSTYQLGFYNLAVGTTYRFAARVRRNPDLPMGVSPGTGNPAIYCINRVSVVSRNSPTAPFDLGYDPSPQERTGRAALPPPGE